MLNPFTFVRKPEYFFHPSQAWHRLRYRTGLIVPVPASAVLQFLFDHVEHAGADGALIYELPEEVDDTLVEVGFKAVSGAPALNTVRWEPSANRWRRPTSET